MDAEMGGEVEGTCEGRESEGVRVELACDEDEGRRRCGVRVVSREAGSMYDVDSRIDAYTIGRKLSVLAVNVAIDICLLRVKPIRN